MTKYEKLAVDIEKARDIGLLAEKEYVAKYGDGGACNLDGAEIKLPRWQAQKVKDVAGGWKHYSGWFVFRPKTNCQGLGRTTNAEAMVKYLRSCGYDCYEYSYMD